MEAHSGSWEPAQPLSALASTLCAQGSPEAPTPHIVCTPSALRDAIGFNDSPKAGDGPRVDSIVSTPRIWVGQYEVLRFIHAGGMGEVFLGYSPALQRKVALKVPSQTSLHALERLIEESRCMADLDHPNIIRVHDVHPQIRWSSRPMAGASDLQGEVSMIVMEYLDGVTLREWLDVGRRAWREVVQVFVQIAQGLTAAHARGLLHGDLTPTNIMIDGTGRAKLVDFGLARRPVVADGAADVRAGDTKAVEQPQPQRAERSGPSFVLEGIFGTPGYGAPEQFAGGVRTLDARTDVFGFCASLWAAVCGRGPFRDSPSATASAHSNSQQQAALRQEWPRGAPRWLRELVLSGLAYTREGRPESMSWLLRRLQLGLDRRKRGVLAVITTAVAMVPAFGVWAWLRAPLPEPLGPEHAGLEVVWNDERSDRLRSEMAAAPAGLQRIEADVRGRIREFEAAWNAARSELRTGRLDATPGGLDLGARCLLDERSRLADVLDAVEAEARSKSDTPEDSAEWFVLANRWLTELEGPGHCADPEFMATASAANGPGLVASARTLLFGELYRGGIKRLLGNDDAAAGQWFGLAEAVADTPGQRSRVHMRLASLPGTTDAAAVDHLQRALTWAEASHDRGLLVEVFQTLIRRVEGSWASESVLALISAAFGAALAAAADPDAPNEDMSDLLLRAAGMVHRIARERPEREMACPILSGEIRSATRCIDDLVAYACPPSSQVPPSVQCLQWRAKFADWRAETAEAEKLWSAVLAMPTTRLPGVDRALVLHKLAALHSNAELPIAAQEWAQALSILRDIGRGEGALAAEITIDLASHLYNVDQDEQARVLLAAVEPLAVAVLSADANKIVRLYYLLSNLSSGAAALEVQTRGVAQLRPLVTAVREDTDRRHAAVVHIMLASSLRDAGESVRARAVLEEQLVLWLPAEARRRGDEKWRELDDERWTLLAELALAAGELDLSRAQVRRAREQMNEASEAMRPRLDWVDAQLRGSGDPQGRALALEVERKLALDSKLADGPLQLDAVRRWLGKPDERSHQSI